MSSSVVASREHPTIQMIKSFGDMTSRSWPKCVATVQELVKLAHPAALAISGFLMLPNHQLKENEGDDASLDAVELGDVIDKYIQFPVVFVKSFEKATAEAEIYSIEISDDSDKTFDENGSLMFDNITSFNTPKDGTFILHLEIVKIDCQKEFGEKMGALIEQEAIELATAENIFQKAGTRKRKACDDDECKEDDYDDIDNDSDTSVEEDGSSFIRVEFVIRQIVYED